MDHYQEQVQEEARSIWYDQQIWQDRLEVYSKLSQH